MASPYEVIPAAAVDIRAELAQLWANSFEALRGGLAEEKVEHFYLSNPAGSGPVFLLREGKTQTDIGVQALISRRFHFTGQPLLAGTMADYAVDSAHRSLGPALQLLKTCIASSKATLAFVYGLPNRKAEPILRRAGLEPVLQLTRYAAPLRSRQYLVAKVPPALLGVASSAADVVLAGLDWFRELRRGGSLCWRDNSGSPSSIDAIWQGAQHVGLMLSDRSAEVLFWRYRPTNSHSSWRIELASVEAGGRAFGYVVWRLRDGVAIISDFLCEKPGEQTAHLLASFRRRMRAQGAGAISLEYCGSPEISRSLTVAGFVPRESCPVYAVIHQALPAADGWYFTGYDRDTD